MKTVRHLAVVVLLLIACAAFSVADTPGKHPAYLHALSDLRDARAHLDRLTPTDRLDNEEEHAIKEIDAAIGEIKHASIDDGKDLNDHPAIDAHLDKVGRYHKALELLDRAHHDISEKEDDQFAHGLRHRALEHIDAAHGTVDRLIVQTSGN
jgi:tetratricopeptide (TPR) repeat protein